MNPGEFELRPTPEDGVSSIKFAHGTNFLLASSWDKEVRLYDVDNNVLRGRYNHKAAVLDCCFSGDDQYGFSGGLDMSIKLLEFNSATEMILGNHEKAVSCLEFHTPSSTLLSGSWDGVMKRWDHRASTHLVSSTNLNEKIWAMDISQKYIMVALADRRIVMFDPRNVATPLDTRESALRNQTRCVKIFPNEEGYAVSSIEGRVAIEYFASPADPRRYAFKCHRANVEGQTTAYPVNALAFHPKQGTFASGGCDGLVNIWDGANRKRVCQLHRYPTSIASLAFNHTGNLLAVASSYTYEQGEREHPQDSIFIRPMAENEVMPRVRAAA
eukprot:GCRY01001493.1.p1 GENE.GCRY01001493.1~~GCRY01001493.1.p1  ORF type:complete len:328 (-),score=49.05 GCRY01001493.1:71-1054(-)